MGLNKTNMETFLRNFLTWGWFIVIVIHLFNTVAIGLVYNRGEYGLAYFILGIIFVGLLHIIMWITYNASREIRG